MSKEEEYLLEFQKVHKDAYDYSKFSYVNSKTKCTFICKTCNSEWRAVAFSHKKGHGCPSCARKVASDKLRGTKESWLNSLLKRHPDNIDKFDYSKVVYVDAKSKVEIVCKTCSNTFSQTPNDHLSGKGCGYCVGRNKTTKSFISESISKFPENAELFDYSKVKYRKDDAPVTIGCNTCGRDFNQMPTKHLQGHKCNLCSLDKQTKEYFMSRVLDAVSNSDRVDFSLCEYSTYTSPVKLLCKVCGEAPVRTPDVTLARGAIGCKCDRGKTGFNSDLDASLYLVNWFNDEVRFLKVGITNRPVKERCLTTKSQARESGFCFEILHEFNTKGHIASTLEREILRKYSDEFSYVSRELFPDGWTETISLSRYDDILKYCKERLNGQSS